MDGFLNLWIIKPGPITNHQQNCCKYYLHNRWTDGQKDECSDKKWTRKRRERQRENKFRFLSRLQQSWPRHLYKQQVETEEGEQVTILLLQSLKCFWLFPAWFRSLNIKVIPLLLLKFLFRLERILGLVGHGAGARQARCLDWNWKYICSFSKVIMSIQANITLIWKIIKPSTRCRLVKRRAKYSLNHSI